MSRFATSTAAKAGRATRPDTVNAAGGEAHAQSPKLALASLVLTSMLQNRSHQDGAGDMSQVRNLIASLAADADLEFAAKAAVYARKVHGLRSISHVVAGEIARTKTIAPWKRKFFDRVVSRVDDAAEIIAYYIATYLPSAKKWTLPNAMRRGIAKALVRFDAYQLAKYQGNNKALSLVDVVNLCHPKAPADHPIHALMKGTLKSADTWETALSKAGTSENAEEAKSQEWERLLREKQLGYLAAVRNIRNIIEQAPHCVEALCMVLTNDEQIAKTRMFPFQYNVARDIVMGMNGPGPKLALKAINYAMNKAVENVPKLDGKTVVVVDESGSMGDGSPKTCFGVASLFAAIILKANPSADLMLFSDTARLKTMDTDNSVLGIQAEIGKHRSACGTNFHAIFQELRDRYDRVIILSDMQGWMGGNTPAKSLEAYRHRTKANPWIYSFDLTGNGTMQFPETGKRVCTLAGWSDKIFTVMEQVERDPQALIAEIEKTEL